MKVLCTGILTVLLIFPGCLNKKQVHHEMTTSDFSVNVIPFNDSTVTYCLDAPCENFVNRYLLHDAYNLYYEWQCCDSANDKMLFHIENKTIWLDTLFSEKFEADQMQFGNKFYHFQSGVRNVLLMDFFWRMGSVAPQARFLLVAEVGCNHLTVAGIKTFNADYVETSDASDCFYLKDNKLYFLRIAFPENFKSYPFKQDTTRYEFRDGKLLQQH